MSVAIITGGLSGIGLATSKMLAGRGVKLAAVSSRVGSSQYKKAETQIKSAAEKGNTTCICHAIDIRNPESVTQGLAIIEESLGNVTILINAAGTYHHEALDNHSFEGWADTISVNLTGPFLMTRACWPMMVAAKHGRIINIASTAAHRGMEEYAGYCSAKAGLIQLTQVTALEGAPHNITSNSISPSWVDTPMMKASLTNRARSRGVNVETLYNEARKDNPQSRIITADEIANQITWLALDAPLALTGEDIMMTGGASW